MHKKNFTIYAATFMIGYSLLAVLWVVCLLRWRRGERVMLTAVFRGVVGDENPAEFREDYDPAEKEIVKKMILAMPSFGCTHYFNNGGCAMCGFNKEIEKYYFRSMHQVFILVLARAFLATAEKKMEAEKYHPEVMLVFMAGSFINKNEFPLPVRQAVIDFFNRTGAKKIVFETRPEYVLSGKDDIKAIISSVAGRKVEIYLGLESVDERIRNDLIKKAVSLETYEKAVKILNDAGAVSGTYILVGAPFTVRDDIIQKAVATAEYCWKAGSRVVNFEIYSVQENTYWCKLYWRGALQIPTLWDVISLIKRVDAVSQGWYLGEFADWPKPIASAINCPECTSEVLGVLKKLRSEHCLSVLSQLPQCSCRPSHI